MGTESLEDSIGPVKIYLTPKTNVWLNVHGVEVLGEVVTSYLIPTQKTTLIEIGCGAGHLGLMLSSVSIKKIRK